MTLKVALAAAHELFIGAAAGLIDGIAVEIQYVIHV
jgi:hypothetical protein